MSVNDFLHRLSLNQLLALKLLCEKEKMVASSDSLGEEMGVRGKSLGGVFSALARQSIGGQPLILPWGQSPSGRGLRWRLNEEVVSKEKVLQVAKEVLAYA